jgi:hypothetical protein
VSVNLRVVGDRRDERIVGEGEQIA